MICLIHTDNNDIKPPSTSSTFKVIGLQLLLRCRLNGLHALFFNRTIIFFTFFFYSGVVSKCLVRLTFNILFDYYMWIVWQEEVG